MPARDSVSCNLAVLIMDQTKVCLSVFLVGALLFNTISHQVIRLGILNWGSGEQPFSPVGQMSTGPNLASRVGPDPAVQRREGEWPSPNSAVGGKGPSSTWSGCAGERGM